MCFMKKTIFFYFCILFISLNSTMIFSKGKIEEDLSGEYFSIAEGYTELKKYEKAVEFYKKAEKSDQYKNAVQYNLAQVYALQNDWVNCLKYLEPIYEQVPENIKIATAYAYALSSSGQEKKALEIYEKIYLKEPETPIYFFNYIRILIVSKKYDEALKLLDENKEKFNSGNDGQTLNSLKEKINNILNPPKEKPKKKTVEQKEEIKKDADKKDIKETTDKKNETTTSP